MRVEEAIEKAKGSPLFTFEILPPEKGMEIQSIYDTIDDYNTVGEEIDSVEDVRAWAPRIYTGALLASREQGAAAGMYSNSAACGWMQRRMVCRNGPRRTTIG